MKLNYFIILIFFINTANSQENSITSLTDNNKTQVVLVKGENEIPIYNNFIIAIDKEDSTMVYSGRFLGIQDSVISIVNRDEYFKIPVSNIRTIYYSGKRPNSFRLACGSIAWMGGFLMMLKSVNTDPDTYSNPTSTAAIWASIYSVIGLAGGTIIDSFQNKIYDRYELIGENHWSLIIN